MPCQHIAPPRFVFAVALPLVIAIYFRRCFFEELPPNTIAIVNYVHKDVPGQPKSASPILMKAHVKSEQNDVLCAVPSTRLQPSLYHPLIVIADLLASLQF